jgi:hypothetical protein
MSYMIVAKASDHIHLMKIVEQSFADRSGEEFETIEPDSTILACRFINKVPLNASNPDLLVNYLEYTETKGDRKYHISWVTNINFNVHSVMRAGRFVRKIENETFNTLKNQGYNLEHNYGHGKQYLATVLATLMFLHFLIDIQHKSWLVPCLKPHGTVFIPKYNFGKLYVVVFCHILYLIG